MSGGKLANAPDSLQRLRSGPVLSRAVFADRLAEHGAQKLFGWWGGHGIRATGGLDAAQRELAEGNEPGDADTDEAQRSGPVP